LEQRELSLGVRPQHEVQVARDSSRVMVWPRRARTASGRQTFLRGTTSADSRGRGKQDGVVPNEGGRNALDRKPHKGAEA
jgi:hypothetical protein